MPNNDPLAAAKAALAHAKSTFPSTGSNGGHDAGMAFAAEHKADPAGNTMSGLMNDAANQKQGLDERANTLKQLLPNK